MSLHFSNGLLKRKQPQVKRAESGSAGQPAQDSPPTPSCLESFTGLGATRSIYCTLFIQGCPCVTSAPSLSPQGTCLK